MAPHSTDVAEYAVSDGLRLRASGASSPESETPLKKYTLEDVSLHSSPTDCWLVIWGKVYDVTRWYEPSATRQEVLLHRVYCMRRIYRI